jgi:hypothetical protein
LSKSPFALSIPCLSSPMPSPYSGIRMGGYGNRAMLFIVKMPI